VSRILIAVTAFNSPWTIREQLRLLRENLLDDHHVFVFDNSDHDLKPEMAAICARSDATYMGGGTEPEHPASLNRAAGCFRALDQPGWELFGETGDTVSHLMWLDHDVYLTAPLRLCPLIDQGGFLGIRQRHPATGVHYAWPGFLAVSRGWLNGRALNFDGIRGEEKRDDGDAGSMTWPIFDVADWSALPPVEHGYRQLREPDDVGLQSWAYEFFRFGDTPEWRHATNVSRWLAVPDPEERERLVREMVEAL
jgi:hypothetical protein